MFDTNVILGGSYDDKFKLLKGFFLCAVVIQELLTGKDREAQKAILATANELERRSLLIVPNKDDWYEVGKCLRILSVSGAFGVSRFTKQYLSCLVRDALIARCAIRANANLITDNTIDFDRIKTVFKSLKHTTPSAFFGTRPR